MVVAALIAMTLAATPALPNGVGRETVLTITAPGIGSRALSLDDLEALPAVRFRTKTIWTSGVQAFEGVRLYTLLRLCGIGAGRVELVAANDYRVTIPMSEVRPDGAVIAYRRNGKVMTTRQKGPLWLIFDYDSDPAFRTETIYARSIWQLDRINVLR